jgi:hypothetical protein
MGRAKGNEVSIKVHREEGSSELGINPTSSETNPHGIHAVSCRLQHRVTEQLHVLSITYTYIYRNVQSSDHGGQYDIATVRSAQADTPSKCLNQRVVDQLYKHTPSVCSVG